jgi:hypothetical protein
MTNSVNKQPRISLAWAAAIYLILSFVFFLPAFMPGQHIYGTDYLAGGYFFYEFISERLGSWSLPKWVPYIFGGLPMAANPGSTYHPVHFIAELLLPTSRVLATIFVVQFWAAGVGTYLLARELDCRPWIALVAGIAFQFTGITLSWVYAGHDGRIIVATLAPAFFYFLHRGVRTASIAPFAGASATLGLALLSFQIQNSYYLLLAAAGWGVFLLFHFGLRTRPRVMLGMAGMGVGAVAYGFILAAVNFLPFLDYIPQSPRGEEGGRGYEYSVSYSMPPGELLSMAVPEQHGASVADPLTGEPMFPAYQGENPFKLHTEYVGAFALIMLALGFAYSRRNRYWWFFLGLSIFGLTLALGGNTPIYRLYYELLPGTKQFRAPSLSFFVVALSLAVMAALTLERLARLRESSEGRGAAADDAARALARLPWIVGAVAGLAFLGAAAAAEGAAEGWSRFALFASLVAGALALWTKRRIGTAAVAVILVVVTTADLWVIGKRFLHTIDPPSAIFAPDDVITFLQAQPRPARIWTFPFPDTYRGNGAYGGDYPMLFEFDQVGGEHPNMLQRWNEYVGAGTATYIDWHNLITDASVVDGPAGQAIAFRGEPGFLDAANVRYIVSMAPLSHPTLREVHRGSALVYQNANALPRAYLVPAISEVAPERMVEAMTAAEWDPARVAFVPPGSVPDLEPGPLTGNAAVVEYEPDRVVVRTTASRDALLVLADNYYEGWIARIDGVERPVLLVNHTFRGVAVPAGEHTIEFVYSPRDLYLGLYVTLSGFALLAVYGGFLLFRRRRRVDAG